MFRLPETSSARTLPHLGLRRRACAAAGRLVAGRAVVRGVVAAALLVGIGCGEDVLVARFGLTSNAPDAGVLEAAAGDAGKSKGNEQSTAAHKARAKARRIDRANDHPPPPRPGDGADDH